MYQNYNNHVDDLVERYLGSMTDVEEVMFVASSFKWTLTCRWLVEIVGWRKKWRTLVCDDWDIGWSNWSSRGLFGVLALSDVNEQQDEEDRIGTPLSRDDGVVVRKNSLDDCWRTSSSCNFVCKSLKRSLNYIWPWLNMK